MKKMNRMLLLVTAVSLSFVLSGCNTVQGFGKDVQKVGDKVESAAKK